MSCERCNAMHRRAQRAEAALHALWSFDHEAFRHLSKSGGSFGRSIAWGRAWTVERALFRTRRSLERIADQGDIASRRIAQELLDYLPEDISDEPSDSNPAVRP